MAIHNGVKPDPEHKNRVPPGTNAKKSSTKKDASTLVCNACGEKGHACRTNKKCKLYKPKKK